MKVSLICDETVHSITDFRQHIRPEFYHNLTFVYQYHYISKIKQNSANFVFLSTGYQHYFFFFCINYHAILPTPVLKRVKSFLVGKYHYGSRRKWYHLHIDQQKLIV